ncbi:Starch-binding associating with outer membrane [Chryseolinea serpens]|uniref:Starch-binding associating with outer membrane n=1 Tax=Chryseolinea serpens TaxID=947013 RepID=A0A1M5X166_9BACT|nr:RagB/SusD family nutrient uptake outer membrane protein [Chryseolinea serpens]SHH93645.1 Starch-binding associating with outer membrane [Chryseolinea serpens]
MKKSPFILYITAMLVFVATSCDVTDLKPVNSMSEDLAYSTPANIELSCVGVYDAAQSGFYNRDETNDRGYIFGAAHIQQGDMRGEDMLLINTFYSFTYQATQSTTTANNVNYWENGFRIINLANLFMEGVRGAAEKGIISTEVAEAYEGEARVLRAITYHTMIIHFARPYRDGNGDKPGLPIFEKGHNSSATADESNQTHRSTVAEVYKFILDDLTYAEAKLPENNAAHHVTRAEKGAAIAMKTRVYLHMGDWANVIAEANKIVSTGAPFTSPVGGYKLTTSVEGPWADNRSSECMLSMEMSAVDDLNTNAALARMGGSPTLGARGEYAISPIIWNQNFWHKDDLRRTLLVRDNGARYYTHKFRDYEQWKDFAPIIRYAEVLLNAAEAEARQNGKAQRALDLLNAIRDRAKAGAMASYTMGDFATAKDLVQGILNERRIELLAEGSRWSDIHRNGVDPDFKEAGGGIPAKMISSDVTSFAAYTIGTLPTSFGVKAIPYDDFRYLWPIPTSEVSINPTLAAEQNPGF